jgi:hypothetical protein
LDQTGRSALEEESVSAFRDPELGMIFTCVIVGALHKYGYDIHIAAIDRSDIIMINKIPSILIFVCSFVRLLVCWFVGLSLDFVSK